MELTFYQRYKETSIIRTHLDIFKSSVEWYLAGTPRVFTE